MIELRDVEVKYGGSSVVEGVSFHVEPGAFVGLVGANGSGKTSLLKVIARMLVPAVGKVLIADREIETYGRRELARLIAGVWPRTPLSFGFTVRQLVLLGRTPHLAPMRWETKVDQEIAFEAMQETQIAHLAERPASQLSAGELQRVFIATALAQQSPILLLDEPTSFLDLRQAARLSSLIERLHRRGVTILCATHDLALLRRHASSVVLLADHRVAAAGDTAGVLVPEALQRAFGITPEEWYD
ncbi:MAG: ABC transporter ATP-binding protein [Acidobacteriota bacterium]